MAGSWVGGWLWLLVVSMSFVVSRLVSRFVSCRSGCLVGWVVCPAGCLVSVSWPLVFCWAAGLLGCLTSSVFSVLTAASVTPWTPRVARMMMMIHDSRVFSHIPWLSIHTSMFKVQRALRYMYIDLYNMYNMYIHTCHNMCK